MDSLTLSEVVYLGNANSVVKYTIAGSLTLVAAEIVHTLPLEISLIWPAQWKLGKILYMWSRYSIFLDAITYIFFATALTIDRCRWSFIAASVSTIFGIAASAAILYLRVYALGGGNRKYAIALILLFTSLHTAILVSLIKFILSLEYIESPFPALIGCFISQANEEELSLVFILLLVSEGAILLITIWIVFKKYRDTKSPFVTILYRDGVVYFGLVSAISAGNIICNLVAPAEYGYLLALPQRALHCILSTRMVLHIYQYRKGPQSIIEYPLTTLRYADRESERADLKKNGRSEHNL